MNGIRLTFQTVLILLFLAATTILGLKALRTLEADQAYNSALDIIAADSGNGIYDLQTAIRLRPDRAKPYQMLARQESFSDPQAAVQQAQKAVQIDPYDWASWRTLGIIYFQMNRPQEAWQAFSHGLPFDQGFQAHYEAANLAYLLGQKAYFWSELKTALSMADRDEIPYALNLAIARSDGSPELLLSVLPVSNLSKMIPATEYLVSRNHADWAAQAWLTIHACPYYLATDCGKAAATIANALIQPEEAPEVTPKDSQANIATAVRIWNRAVHQSWLHQDPVTIGTSGDLLFQHAWSGPAFSWASNYLVPHQVLQIPESAGRGEAIFQFDGSEPQSVQLFHQFVAVRPNTHYVYVCNSKLLLPGQQSGIAIAITHRGKTLSTSPVRPSGDWVTTQQEFATDDSTYSIDLQILYQRPIGQMLLRTPVAFSDIAVRPVH